MSVNLLEEKQVPEFLVGKLKEEGIWDLAAFALLDESTEGTGYTANAHQCVRGGTARFLAAWLSSKEIARHDVSEAAKARASRLPWVLPDSDHLAMRAAFEATVKSLEDDHCPSLGLMEIRLAMLTAGELKAEPLTRVTPKGFHEEAPVAAEITASGEINVKKTSKEISMPSDAEERRDRLRIWGASWMFAASRFPSEPVLGDVDVNVITDCADYLNGPKARRLEAKDAEGRVVASPPWKSVLSYEWEICKLQAHVIN